jgi:hypothetical protein
VEDDVERHDVSNCLGRTWAKFSACAEKIGRHGTFRTVSVTQAGVQECCCECPVQKNDHLRSQSLDRGSRY